MKPINESKFEVFEARDVREFLGISVRVKEDMAALKCFFYAGKARDNVPVRLQRDAGIDEMDMELRRIAKAPLIR